MLATLHLVGSLGWPAYLRWVIWFTLGTLFYVCWGMWHSHLPDAAAEGGGGHAGRAGRGAEEGGGGAPLRGGAGVEMSSSAGVGGGGGGAAGSAGEARGFGGGYGGAAASLPRQQLQGRSAPALERSGSVLARLLGRRGSGSSSGGGGMQRAVSDGELLVQAPDLAPAQRAAASQPDRGLL
jgi:APA family basic amino acid/polyamine antiporter